MDCANRPWMAYRNSSSAQRGASIVEAVIALPILLVFILGAIQFGLVYEAKATLNHASLQAARLGSVRNADPAAIRRGLARGLAPLHSPDSSLQGIAQTIARIEASLPTDARIRILNPTREAFEDFGVDVDGEREIPSDRLHTRSTTIGSQSGVNIQDANLLKVQITYGYELQVPLVNWFIARVLLGVRGGADAFEQQQLRRTRLPIMATATVRMQTPARLSDAVVSTNDFPELERIPSNAAPPPVAEESDDEGEEESESGGSTPGNEREDDDASSLDDGFFGFGGGDPGSAGGGSGGSDGGGSGGGVNGGNPQQCSADDGGGPAPFPFDETPGDSSPLPGSPGFPDWFDRSSGGGASLGNVSLASLSVGNPIHVATGNKYQREVDMPNLPGHLSLGFQRHYNSAAVAERSVIGAGWRHSFEAQLQASDQTIRIVQADGRLLRFVRQTQAGRFVGVRASDGVVFAGNGGYRWRWNTGRELLFDLNGRLAQIRDREDVMRLNYDDEGQLVTVTDPQARTLRFAYYPNGRVASVRAPGKAAMRFTYDEAGNLVQATASDGQARRYSYEDERHPHHLSTVSLGTVRPLSYGERNTFERIASWAYDEHGRAVYSSHPDDAGKVTLQFAQDHTEVTDAFGRKTLYLIGWRDEVAYVREVRGPGCGACAQGDVAYEYDARLNPIRVAVKGSPSLSYRYDDEGRLVEVARESASAHEWLMRYRYEGATSRVTNIERPSVKSGEVATLRLEYGADGRLQRMREFGFAPDADRYRRIERETTLTYDARGRLIRIDGPRSDVDDWTDLEYDDLDRLIAIRHAAGERRVLAHDRSGRPTHITQTGRPDLKFAYDARGRVSAMTQLKASGPIQVTYAYDSAGRLAKIVDALGRSVRYGYDAAGRPNRMTSSASAVTAVARYAPDDNIDRMVALGRDGQVLQTLYYAYDSARRLLEVRDGDGQPLQQLVYDDADARPDRRFDPLGNQTSFEYDAVGQLAAVLAPDGGLTRFERDPHGRTTSVIAANQASTSYEHDDFGRRVLERSADRGVTRYKYDAANNLVEKVDARGAATRLTYDAGNRLTRVTTAEGESTLSYSNGMLAHVQHDSGEDRYRYDRDGQLTEHLRRVGDRHFVTRFGYDAHGRIERRDLPSGARLRYRYGSNGELHAIVQERWLNDRTVARTLASDVAAAKLTAFSPVEFGNGVTIRSSFDARSSNLSRRAIDGVAMLEYQHDDAGRITRIRRDGAERRYAYDAVGRLTRMSAGAAETKYAYDTNGNRVSVSSGHARDRATSTAGEVSSSAPNYTYEPATNRLATTEANSYRYDEAGNPLDIGRRRFEYDTGGRVTKVFEADRLIAEYHYNFWGERVQKIVHANGKPRVTHFVYEEQKLIAEADARGHITREYVYLDHHPIAVIEEGQIFTVHTDHLGTPIAVTSPKQSVVWRAQYEPFGEAQIESDPDADGESFTLNLRFPGQYADAETNTHYNYFRTYDPKTGRYLTADPIGLGGGLNNYLYVGASPLRGSDTLGLYDEMVHYYMTYFLGLVAGLPQDVARTIAIATQYVDENYLTQPIHGLVSPNTRALPLYHFVMDYDQAAYGDSNDDPYRRFLNPDSGQLRNLLNSTDPARLRDLWVQTHPSPIPNACPIPSFADINDARYQLFGEYLHAFEDTFSHRDAYNMSYAAGSNPANTPVALMGHAGPNVPDFFGHAPDNTYNQNFRSPSRCTVGTGRAGRVAYNMSRTECAESGGRNYVAANDDDTTECEVRYVLGVTSVERGVTETQCEALGRGPGALTSTYRPGTGDIWAFNELRTLRMEYEVFSRIQSSFSDEIARHRQDVSFDFEWEDIAGAQLDAFNPNANSRIGLEVSFEEWASANGYERTGTSALYNPALVLQQFNSSREREADRLSILNEWLLRQELTNPDGSPVQIEEWSEVQTSGGRRRRENIGWIPRGSLDGVLLPADSPCQGRGCP